MANRRERLTSFAVTTALVALNIVALNFLVSGWSTARVDLTEEGLFSISPATRQILTGLDEPVIVYGYFSKRTHPKLAPLVPELVDLLDEYRAVSGGKVEVEILDPGENDDIEQEATDRYGVQSTPFRLASKYEASIVNAYFAVVVKYGDQYVRYGFDDLIEIQATPDGDIDVRLRNPEYDLTRAIKKVVFGFRSTNDLFDRIQAPVKLTAIWTPAALPEIFAKTPEAVRKAYEELHKVAGDRLSFEEIDPTGDDAKRQAIYEHYGARPMSLGLFSQGEFYLYALLDVGGQLEQIPLTGEVTAASVREAIESSLRRHSPGFLKTVGVVTSEGPQIPPQLRMQMQMPPQPPPEFEEIKNVLRQDYQVRDVDLATGDGVPSEVDVLLVLEPKELGQEAVYNLDQYLMRGGRVILCAGNYDVNFDQTGLRLAPVSTGIEEWLGHYGVTVDKMLVLDDQNQPLPIPEMRNTPFGTMRTWRMAPYPYLVQVRDAGFRNREVTASLDAVGIYWGSPLRVDEKATAGLTVTPLLQSSPRSWTSDDLSRVPFVDYEVPHEGTQAQLLAVALGGKFKSFFAGKPVPGSDASAPATDPDKPDEKAAGSHRVALEESPETRLIVVGNAEFLSDFVARALASVDGGFFTENLRFAQNLIDWAGLDNDMLGIRARGMVSRRLDRRSKAEETLIEGVNYASPVVLLVALGAFLEWRRRHTVPLTAVVAGNVSVPPMTEREVGR